MQCRQGVYFVCVCGGGGLFSVEGSCFIRNIAQAYLYLDISTQIICESRSTRLSINVPEHLFAWNKTRLEMGI